MPLYVFQCLDCDEKFERLCSYSTANNGVNCPRCNGKNVERAVSSFASFSKGEGGVTKSVGGSSGCASCASSNCSSCH